MKFTKILLSGAVLTGLAYTVSSIAIPDTGTIVSGTIRIGGRPLKDADVAFVRTDGDSTQPTAIGHTDSVGHYRLRQPLEAGPYRIVVQDFAEGNVQSAIPFLADADRISVPRDGHHLVDLHLIPKRGEIAQRDLGANEIR